MAKPILLTYFSETLLTCYMKQSLMHVESLCWFLIIQDNFVTRNKVTQRLLRDTCHFSILLGGQGSYAEMLLKALNGRYHLTRAPVLYHVQLLHDKSMHERGLAAWDPRQVQFAFSMVR